MDKEPIHEMVINGLLVEIYDGHSEKEDYIPQYWLHKKIFIYDALSDLSERERDAVIDYLYNEGFVDDRRTKCEVIRGEDYL